MNHAVIWQPPAETALIACLLRSADKPGDWALVHEIEARLRVEPLQAGESREDDFRLLYVRPFAVLYWTDQDARTVYVEELQWVGR